MTDHTNRETILWVSTTDPSPVIERTLPQSSSKKATWQASTCADQAYLPGLEQTISEPSSNDSTSFESKSIRQVQQTPHLWRRIASTFSTFWYNWKWEALLSILVLATPFIILATVFPHVGGPLPQWPFHITINATLAIYAVIFKACLAIIIASCIGQLQWSWFSKTNRPLYDVVRYSDAAQGPWGSLKLLLRHNFQQPLAAFGALLLILSTAVEPFVQQITSLYDCSILLETQTATLPRTNKIVADIVPVVDVNFPFGSTFSTIVYNPRRILPRCSTGNCTFAETYRTVGYCSTCKDRSSDIIFKTECLPQNVSSFIVDTLGSCPQGTGLSLVSSLQRELDTDRGHAWTNIIWNSPFSAMFTASSSHIVDGEISRGAISNSGFQSDILLGKTFMSAEKTDLITGKYLPNCHTEADRNAWRCRGYGAASCTLRPCVRTYNATIVNGELNERLISTSGSLVWGLNATNQLDYGLMFSFMVDTHCLSNNQTTWLKQRGYKVDASSQWLSYNGQTIELTKSLLKDKCLYQIENAHMVDPSTNITRYMGFRGPDFLLQLFNNGDTDFERIQSAFANISDTLTAWIRTHGNETSSEDAIGQVFKSSTCVHAQWEWLAYPSALALLTLLLFFLVVITTTNEQTPVWKDSPLAWIMRGPGGLGTKDDGFTKAPTVENMEGIAKKIVVKLAKGVDAQIQLVEDRSRDVA